ncbi:MAG: M20/M25/M40 family metallo-hydrolase [Desulfamplus sp.]|nr:M20/M25/M40 family metallo-hydrolase [Desulfamplus sp.]
MINSKRIAQRFTAFAEIDSVSREEAGIARALKESLEKMGAQVFMDGVAEKVGGNCGNLVARFKGSVSCTPILLSGHMDTVEPGRGVKVTFKEGTFVSDGTTILGSDDKSALAIILEVMDVIIENNLPCPPIDIVFTVCEEIGLLGAKNFDLSMIDARIGYILDSTDTEGIVTRAPCANRFTIKIHGKDAHAGAFPERGINAIAVAARAISSIEWGRLDHETTSNVGQIQGGRATNIVPELVTLQGEVRSHDPQKLKDVTERICKAFHGAADHFMNQQTGFKGLPRVEIDVEEEFPATNIANDHPVVTLARQAAKNLGKNLECKTVGGGADANVFFGKGIVTGVLGTGMTDVHTVRESIRLEDMEKTAFLILEILRLHAVGTCLE